MHEVAEMLNTLFIKPDTVLTVQYATINIIHLSSFGKRSVLTQICSTCDTITIESVVMWFIEASLLIFIACDFIIHRVLLRYCRSSASSDPLNLTSSSVVRLPWGSQFHDTRNSRIAGETVDLALLRDQVTGNKKWTILLQLHKGEQTSIH